MKAPASILGGSALIAIMIATTPAFAQTAEAPSSAPQADENTGEIVVTAQRREQKLSEVPLSITAITAARLQQSGISATTDLATVTPGLQYPVSGAFAQPTIRGIGSTVTSAGSDANVALYVDGVYMPSQAANIFNFNNIDRIEVLKGPQGTLYGRNATGGAINITTLAPSFKPIARLSASYGRFDEVRLNAYGSGPISDTVAVAIAGIYTDDNGYAKDVIRGVRLATYDERGVRAKVLVKPTETFEITVAADWSRKTDLTGYSLKVINGNTAQNVTIRPGVYNLQLSLTPDFTTESKGASVTAKLDLGDYTLSSISSARKVDADFLTDLDRTEANASVASFDTHQKTYTQELNIASGAEGAFSWVGGVFYYHDKADNLNLRTNGVLSVTGHIKSEAVAGYAEGTYDIGDALSVIGGIRYSTEKRHFTANRPTGTPLTLDTSVKYDSWTPRASIRYKIAEGANVYATYSQGFKSGTYNISSFSTVPVRPEKVRALEAGFKYYSRGISLSTAAFRYLYDDIQIQAIAGGLTTLTNAAKAKIYGFEAQINAPVGGGFSLDAGVAYTHSRYSDFPAALVTTPRTSAAVCGVNPNRPCGNVQGPGNASGNEMVRSPEWTANLTASYEGQIATGTLRASATGSYNGGFYWDAGNRLKQPAYFIANGRISWGPDDSFWRVALWGKNLTDKRYQYYAVDTTQADAASFARPRSYGVALELAFD
jgi:iron complex outermembrane receptor protein